MNVSDTCCDCEGEIDVTKRIYRGPGNKPRCPVCQIIAEMRLEIAKVTAIVELMAEASEGRLH